MSYIPIPNTTKQQTSTRSSKPQSPKRGQRLKSKTRGHGASGALASAIVGMPIRFIISCLLLITFLSNHRVIIEIVI